MLCFIWELLKDSLFVLKCFFFSQIAQKIWWILCAFHEKFRIWEAPKFWKQVEGASNCKDLNRIPILSGRRNVRTSLSSRLFLPQGLASFLLLYSQTFPAGSMAAYLIPPPRWNCKIWKGQGCVSAPMTLTMLSHGHFTAVQWYKACTLPNLYPLLSMYALERKVLQLAGTHL